MRVVRPWTHHQKARHVLESAHLIDGMQLEKVVDDFSLAFRQREIATQAWRVEHNNFAKATSRVIDVIDNGFANWLGSALRLLDPKNQREFPGDAGRSQKEQLRLMVLCTLLGGQALAFGLRGQNQRAPDDRPELLSVLKRATAMLQPYFAAAGSELGISESLPGVTVHGSGEAISHIVLNVLVDVLRQAADPQRFALAMASQDGTVNISLHADAISRDGGISSRRWCLDARSQGLQLAVDIARDQDFTCEWLPDSGGLARIGFAAAGVTG